MKTDISKIGPAHALAIVASSAMFITSLEGILLQHDIRWLAPIWELLLLISAALIAISAVRSSAMKGEPKRIISICIDCLLLLALSYLSFSGFINPDTNIRLEGLGAAFGYGLVLPSLILAASIIIARDTVSIAYGFSQKGRQILVFTAIRLSAVLSLTILGGILFLIAYHGLGAISWDFLTQPHRRLGQQGGIFTCIEGSFWLILGAMLVSAPIGIGAAIYLNEYSRNIRFNRLITIAVSCLNGVPSVVYGLFGLAFLVSTFGISLLAGSIVLGLMNLPTIILTSQVALKSVPNSLREGSMALGATKWLTIKNIVIPSSMPGILTGLIIGVAKAAGETAPIMWTAVTFTATPVQKVYGVVPDVFQPVNNLCYHLLQLIYFLGAWDVEQNAWGTALVLMVLVLLINMAAIVVRNHYRKKISW